jgi:hypothetical protein
MEKVQSLAQQSATFKIINILILIWKKRNILNKIISH